jgi:predicted transcriptional regulator
MKASRKPKFQLPPHLSSNDWVADPMRCLALAVIQNALDDIALRRGNTDTFNVHPWSYMPQKYAGEIVTPEEVIEWLSSEGCEFWCAAAGIHPDDVSREALARMIARDDAIWLM